MGDLLHIPGKKEDRCFTPAPSAEVPASVCFYDRYRALVEDRPKTSVKIAEDRTRWVGYHPAGAPCIDRD